MALRHEWAALALAAESHIFEVNDHIDRESIIRLQYVYVPRFDLSHFKGFPRRRGTRRHDLLRFLGDVPMSVTFCGTQDSDGPLHAVAGPLSASHDHHPSAVGDQAAVQLVQRITDQA